MSHLPAHERRQVSCGAVETMVCHLLASPFTVRITQHNNRLMYGKSSGIYFLPQSTALLLCACMRPYTQGPQAAAAGQPPLGGLGRHGQRHGDTVGQHGCHPGEELLDGNRLRALMKKAKALLLCQGRFASEPT